jgi:hypothetical protein
MGVGEILVDRLRQKNISHQTIYVLLAIFEITNLELRRRSKECGYVELGAARTNAINRQNF